jgi:phage shock protein PspC (stress-responsive transcriptional regulator)
VRSTNHRLVAGVCGGLAARLDLSPFTVRVLWLLFSLLPGPLFILYIALWIVLPAEPT